MQVPSTSEAGSGHGARTVPSPAYLLMAAAQMSEERKPTGTSTNPSDYDEQGFAKTLQMPKEAYEGKPDERSNEEDVFWHKGKWIDINRLSPRALKELDAPPNTDLGKRLRSQ